MICLIAMFVFGFLGIFSLKYRKIATEAFDCVFRRMTLRKCTSGLDKRLKSQITGNVMKQHPRTGKFVFKHFEFISWVFTVLMFWSIISTGISGYNYYMYGNCNGPQDGGVCIFDPSGEYGEVTSCDGGDVSGGVNLGLNDADLSLFPFYDSPSDEVVVYAGCYLCENTRKANPTINEFLNTDDVDLYFIHVPIHAEYEFFSIYGNCIYDESSADFWKFHNELFNTAVDDFDTESKMNLLVDRLDIDKESVLNCVESQDAKDLLEKQLSEIKKMGIEGTPTVFVNGEPLVGVRPLRAYKNLLN